MNIAEALGDVNAAIIVQQLNYWLNKPGVGTTIGGTKYIYNTFNDWVNKQFRWLSVWQFRKSMNILRSHSIIRVIRHQARQWNQTNYYTLDRDRLIEFLSQQTAQSIEIVEMCATSAQDETNQHLKVSDSQVSLYESKTTTKKQTTNKKSDRFSKKESQNSAVAAAPPKKANREPEDTKPPSTPQSESNSIAAQFSARSAPNQPDLNQEKELPQIDFLVNVKWRSLIPLLDSVGISINKTIEDLLKMYSAERVENAVAIYRQRKRQSHIPNPAGYFVAALKSDWASSTIVNSEDEESVRSDRELDSAAVFRHWYDLARELGYCSGQEVRQGEQWICLSGSWERWSSAAKRGYSLDYLKKIMKRNNSR